MRFSNCLLFFLLIGFYSCGENAVDTDTVNPLAAELNNKAMALAPFIDNQDSAEKAIILLDSATAIDSNSFYGHYNKLMFLNQLKRYDKAILTVNHLIQRNPSAHDLYLMNGMLHEKKGDSVGAIIYFEKSLAICNTVLDTMNPNNMNYMLFVSNKAINLVMLGDTTHANVILKQFHDTQPDKPEIDNLEKKHIQSLMHKDRAQLLELTNGPDRNQPGSFRKQ